jgi:hypothetical protein
VPLQWGLKVNAEKLTFCALEIEYLEYILTRDGIKPQSNKVQAILTIQLLTNAIWLESVVRPKSQEPKGPRRCPGIGMRSIKELSIM